MILMILRHINLNSKSHFKNQKDEKFKIKIFKTLSRIIFCKLFLYTFKF